MSQYVCPSSLNSVLFCLFTRSLPHILIIWIWTMKKVRKTSLRVQIKIYRWKSTKFRYDITQSVFLEKAAVFSSWFQNLNTARGSQGGHILSLSDYSLFIFSTKTYQIPKIKAVIWIRNLEKICFCLHFGPPCSPFSIKKISWYFHNCVCVTNWF